MCWKLALGECSKAHHDEKGIQKLLSGMENLIKGVWVKTNAKKRRRFPLCRQITFHAEFCHVKNQTFAIKIIKNSPGNLIFLDN